MKRVLLTVALCVAASVSFAQKKAVNEAQSIAKGTTPDFSEARTLIKGALENPETKDDAKTWYVAGFIEDQQFSNERTKQVLGQQPDEPVMYEALGSILPYFEKAYELDQLPNEKGKIKPKFTKDIKGILGANHVYYINGGAYYFDQKDYNKAYDFFEQYLKISDMPMFKGEAVAERDSNFMTVQFYAAVAATQLGDSQKAIAALERAKNTDYRASEVYQYLCYEYEQAKDTVNLEKTLEEGLNKFPDYIESLSNLGRVYYNQGVNKQGEANMINDAKQYQEELGKAKEFFKQALPYFEKAHQMKPEEREYMTALRGIYYNLNMGDKFDAIEAEMNK